MKERERHRLFVEHFMGGAAGNATKAVLMAGFTKNRRSAKVIGTRLLTNVNVQAMIAARRDTAPEVMTRAELQQFWTAIARDKTRPDSIRMQASVTLSKALGLFIDRQEVREDVHYHISWDEDEQKNG